MHTHDENHVEMLGRGYHAIDRGLGIDSDRCARAKSANPLRDFGNIGTNFAVDRDRIGTRFDEYLEIFFRLADHQMRIERKRGDLSNRLQHRHTHRDVGHEMAVHHVEMDQVSARPLDRANLLAHAIEIRRQYRGSDFVGLRHLSKDSACESHPQSFRERRGVRLTARSQGSNLVELPAQAAPSFPRVITGLHANHSSGPLPQSLLSRTAISGLTAAAPAITRWSVCLLTPSSAEISLMARLPSAGRMSSANSTPGWVAAD